MKLLIDVGNTRIKWALWTAGGRAQSGALLHRELDQQAMQDWLGQLPARPLEVRLACVAQPELVAQIQALVQDCWGLGVLQVETACQAGDLRNGYHDWRQLGVDRWLALRAARSRWPAAACLVVDAGTAVTLDGLSAAGEHLGGLILPGLALYAKLLDGSAARLAPLAAGPAPALLPWARDTAAARQQAPALATAALIDRCAAELAAAADGPVQVLLTGGDAGQLQPLLQVPATVHPWLVLEGLALD